MRLLTIIWSCPMASLPNQSAQPIPLDTLLARHAQPHARPASARVAYRPGGNAPPTLAELEHAASLSPPPLRDDNTPRAVVLCLTRTTCKCGHVYVTPNSTILVRYDKAGFSNSVHYNRESVAPYAGLPRERKYIDTTADYCEECFGA